MGEEKEKNEAVENVNEEKKPMSRTKKRCIKWGIAVAVVFLVLLFLPGILVTYIVPPVASGMLKVPVEIDSAFINVFDGAVRIKGMRIHNPEGYEAPYALELGHFYVDVEMMTLFSPKLVIKDVVVEDMHATLEMKLTSNNLADIGKALEQPEPPQEDAPEPEEVEEVEEDEGEPQQMVIRRLLISNCDFTMLKVPWPIPSIELTDVGDGRPVSDFAIVVYDSVVEAVIQASKAIGKGAGNVGSGVVKAAESIGESAGEAVDNVGKSLKKIFGK